MFLYYATYLIGRCEGEISLVRPFICVVPSLPPPPSLVCGASPHVRTCAHIAQSDYSI